MDCRYLSLHRPQIRLLDVFSSFSAKHPKELLEDRLGAYLGTRIKLTGSGRCGLKIILESLKITAGVEVIMPSFICPSVADAVIESGASPVFADVAENDINIDPESVEKAITGKTKAIIIAHIFGIPAQIDKFLEIAQKYNLPLIEDCGQSFGAQYGGQFTGTLGDFGFFSFGISKNISGVAGGAICWKESRAEQVRSTLEETASKLKMQHRATPAQQYLLALSAPFVFNKYAYRVFRGFISKYADSKRLKSPFSSYDRDMTNLEAGLVLRQLARYSRILNIRSNNVEVYREYLSKDFKLINIPAKATPAYLYFPVLVDNPAALRHELALRSIEVKGKEGMYFDALYKHLRFDKYSHVGSNVEKVEEEYLLFPTAYSRDETEWICRESLKVVRSLRE